MSIKMDWLAALTRSMSMMPLTAGFQKLGFILSGLD
jgi:hypothetical protein